MFDLLLLLFTSHYSKVRAQAQTVLTKGLKSHAIVGQVGLGWYQLTKEGVVMMIVRWFL